MRGVLQEAVIQDGPSAASDRLARLFLQLAVLAFWLPCTAWDGWLLWQGGLERAAGFTFWLLFRQALVFLALWFAVAVPQGLLRGRRTPREPQPRRRPRQPMGASPASAALTLSRHGRGQ